VPTYRDEAIVLRTHKLGEADRIITMLGRRRGVIRAVAKGVRKTSSRFGSRLEPFMLVDVQCYEGRSLDTVTQVVTLGAYGAAIAADYGKYTAGSAIAEAAARLTEEDGPAGHGDAPQFALLAGALRSLAAGEHAPQAILDSYLLRALAIAGWAPALDACAVTGAPGPHSAFVIPAGGLVADEVAPPGVPRLDAATLELMTSLAAGDWTVVDRAEPDRLARVSGLIAAYSQYQLERGLRALRHVEHAS